MKRLLACVLAGAMLAQPALAQHGDEGDIAFRRGLAHRSGGDGALAAHWLGVAAARGMPEAMFLLANLLLDGEGVARDEAAARRWLEAAAELDYPEAWQQLALMEPDAQKAVQLMRRAAHALTHRGVDKR
ncbi:MAG: tetratricopeptide repeat protein [Telluria sp.]